MKIYLFNLAVDTTNDLFHINNNVEKKLELIENALKKISAELEKTEYDVTKNNKIRAIFVAPEYFFAKGFPEHYIWQNKPIPQDRTGRHYSYEEYEEIRRNLTVLSRNFPQVLVVPGTVAWKKPAVPRMATPLPGTNTYAPVPSWPVGTRKNKEEYFKWMKSLGETPTQESFDDYYKEAPDRQILIADNLLRKDCGTLYGGNEGLSLQDKKFIVGTRKIEPEQYIAELKKLEFGLAYNTAFFYLRGKKFGEYSKHSDHQEVLYADAYQQLTVALLTKEPSVQVVEGITFGIEICLDYCCHILKTYLSRSTVFITVGDFDCGEYYFNNWPEHINDVLKESTDAYYRYRSFKGDVNKLYYFSHNTKPIDITPYISDFDNSLNITYNGASLLINNKIEAAGGGSHKEILTQEKSINLFKGLKINTTTRNFKPDIHLVLSACVQNKVTQGHSFIHSSSNPDYNTPDINFKFKKSGIRVYCGEIEIGNPSILKYIPHLGSPIYSNSSNRKENISEDQPDSSCECSIF